MVRPYNQSGILLCRSDCVLFYYTYIKQNTISMHSVLIQGGPSWDMPAGKM